METPPVHRSQTPTAPTRAHISSAIIRQLSQTPTGSSTRSRYISSRHTRPTPDLTRRHSYPQHSHSGVGPLLDWAEARRTRRLRPFRSELRRLFQLPPSLPHTLARTHGLAVFVR